MTRGSQESQQTAILRAAMKVISERGLPETRMADIADEVGVSAPALLHWFTTKDELLAQALAYADQLLFDRVQDELAKEESSIRQLRWFVRHNMNLGGSTSNGWRQDWNLWIEVWARSLHDETVRTVGRVQDARWKDLIRGIIEGGRDNGEFTAGDPDEFAVLLLSLMDGLAVQLALRDPRMSRKRAMNMCLDLIATYLAPTAPESGRIVIRKARRANEKQGRVRGRRKIVTSHGKS